MIRHEQQDSAEPDQLRVIECGGGEHGIPHTGAGELVSSVRLAIDRDEEQTAFGDPNENVVGQTSASRQVHPGDLTRGECEWKPDAQSAQGRARQSSARRVKGRMTPGRARHSVRAGWEFGCPLTCGRARRSARAVFAQRTPLSRSAARTEWRALPASKNSIFFERCPQGQRMPFMATETECLTPVWN